MSLIEKAKAWSQSDPDLETKTELEKLIATENLPELQARFEQLLQFGTAGLRGELGAGPSRMNRVVVAYAALAIANFLKDNRDQYLDSNGELSVVIGFDGRENSDIFALDSAKIIAAAGCQAFLFDQQVPTPVAAFTGRRLSASATIVVTASHNPPRDNGYKVYLGGKFGGSQLISPQDKEIAERIAENYRNLNFQDIPVSDKFQTLTNEDISHYIQRAKDLVPTNNGTRANLNITHTALHGVGWPVVEKLFGEMQFKIKPVREQMIADSEFPTVSFPNPEEAGAMDLAYATASDNHSDLIIANDPDADRLAVAIPHEGAWRMLTGDEVGLLLADYCASRVKSGAIANSIVSADLSALAAHYRMKYEQTLTGFKWISKVPDLVYGYEEALGYCVDPAYTPDKDGITAALLIAEMAANLKASGHTLANKLEELSAKFGEVSTGQISIRVNDLSIIGKVMKYVREMKSEVFEGELEKVDLAKSKNLKTDAVILQNQKVRMIFRPSGTEPKLKCYLQYQGDKKGLERLKVFANSLLSNAQSAA